MTDGPPPNPDTPDAFPPAPQGPVPRYTPGQPASPAETGRLSGGTQQAWNSGPVGFGGAPQQPGASMGGATQQPRPVQQGPQKNAAPGVLALVCGILGVVVPILPFPLDNVRAWIAFPFAVAALGLGAVGCGARRPTKALAVIGIVFGVLALVIGVIMVGNRLGA
ncbi:hypothetical protein VSH64_23380 [Amycolatopsis rhabdoformis]|uniref:DUF4190 domain-containing protein n=1 Tax=Amycolatopsis rhabdoformis TaxID=1448059 RepID=A0ABZ1IKI6_9PSEU|nr:hypothetical protein [Amycolatopsis rhabdoformis]WSE34981.1 hypothetical protein VSH64_23380 [Amycolatopsis rhabdoformis]